MQNDDAYEVLANLMVTAAKRGDLNTIRLAISAGADPNIEDGYGDTILIVGADRGDLNVIRLAIDAGADPNFQNRSGCTALWLEAHDIKIDVIKYLLENKASPNIQSEGGVTALMRAAMGGVDVVVDMFLKAGADPNIQDEYGNTALMHDLVCNGWGSRYEMFLKAGADPNIRNSRGETALMIAAENETLAIVKDLLEVEGINRAGFDEIVRKKLKSEEEKIQNDVAGAREEFNDSAAVEMAKLAGVDLNGFGLGFDESKKSDDKPLIVGGQTVSAPNPEPQ